MNPSTVPPQCAVRRVGRARFCEPYRRLAQVFAVDDGFGHCAHTKTQWRFRGLRSPLCWRRYVLPTRETLWRDFCALAVEARELALDARRRRVAGAHQNLSHEVFNARHRVSPGRSEGFLCPGCGLACVLERHGDTLDQSGRRGTFELFHEAPSCEAFQLFSYTMVVTVETKRGMTQGVPMRIATRELQP